MRSNIFTAMKEIQILRWGSRLWNTTLQAKKGLVNGFSANSVTEAAQALIQISIKNRLK
jgi:hypothetical protein